ncbi:hypothetical protein GTO27_11890 [Candidatus Bathyarchaeota archaeon]|nr:hypothetical protein [Candidatus Bathyarchaeota archaeon]
MPLPPGCWLVVLMLRTVVLPPLPRYFGQLRKGGLMVQHACIIYPDGSWMLLRPSGTEPVLRLYAESQDFKRVQEIVKVGSELIKESLLCCAH